MSFFEKNENKNNKERLSTEHRINQKAAYNSLSSDIQKRISLRLSAVATVEASLIIPVIIFLFVSIIWMVDLFYIHSEMGADLDSVGKEIVAYSYPYAVAGNDGGESELANLAASVGRNEIYVKSRIKEPKILGNVSQVTTLMSSGSYDEIDIVLTYRVEPLLTIPGIKGVYLTNHFYSKAYVGYTGNDAESDETVYITRTGVVYHTSLNCRILKTTINKISMNAVEKSRNESGSKYYACEFCNFSNHNSEVYITPTGNRYHSSEKCFQLKTDIFEIPLSEAGGRGKCKYCK